MLENAREGKLSETKVVAESLAIGRSTVVRDSVLLHTTKPRFGFGRDTEAADLLHSL